MAEATRAKFRCRSVEQTTDKPTEVQRYNHSGQQEPTGMMTWPRTYRFEALYDPNVAEDRRYAQATPVAHVEMRVDNPAVVFEPGRAYYFDITPAED